MYAVCGGVLDGNKRPKKTHLEMRDWLCGMCHIYAYVQRVHLPHLVFIRCRDKSTLRDLLGGGSGNAATAATASALFARNASLIADAFPRSRISARAAGASHLRPNMACGLQPSATK